MDVRDKTPLIAGAVLLAAGSPGIYYVLKENHTAEQKVIQECGSIREILSQNTATPRKGIEILASLNTSNERINNQLGGEISDAKIANDWYVDGNQNHNLKAQQILQRAVQKTTAIQNNPSAYLPYRPLQLSDLGVASFAVGAVLTVIAVLQLGARAVRSYFLKPKEA